MYDNKDKFNKKENQVIQFKFYQDVSDSSKYNRIHTVCTYDKVKVCNLIYQGENGK